RRITQLTLAAAFVVLTTMGAKAQYAWDFGMHLGAANYLGEMGGKDQPRRDFVWDMKLGQTRWCVGGFARRKINRLLSVNTGLLYLRIQGADENTEYKPRHERNLNFRNDMIEWYLRPEVTIFQDNDLGGRGKYKLDFRLFAYAGVALFYSNPFGQYTGQTVSGVATNGEWVALRPLKTELADYSSLGVSIPVGIGFHFTQKRRHRFGFDIGWRTTFTDYLDDASTVYKNPTDLPGGAGGLADLMADQHVQGSPLNSYDYNYGWWDSGGPSKHKDNIRGDPSHNDSYLTCTFTYSYVLRGQSNFYRQRYSWIRGAKRVGRKSRAKF
ncbi:MAG TPA: DUF6089 family protein, partial [Flavobacteriales bacterium]|nr:DUF6089 family protein [Flavobacteriales bacterium]